MAGSRRGADAGLPGSLIADSAAAAMVADAIAAVDPEPAVGEKARGIADLRHADFDCRRFKRDCNRHGQLWIGGRNGGMKVR
jgi:hypothetical protein